MHGYRKLDRERNDTKKTFGKLRGKCAAATVGGLGAKKRPRKEKQTQKRKSLS